MNEPMRTEAEEHSIDFNAWYPNLDQFASFGGPVDDPDRSDTAKTIKPLMDATHDSLKLIVSSVGSINTILQSIAPLVPVTIDENGGGSNVFEQLNDSVSKLVETFDKINPSEE